MGITEIARLPTFSNLQLLYSHLNSNFSPTSSSRWTLTISSYRSLPFSTSTNTTTNTKGRILWTINDTSFPAITFVFIEDLSKPDRETYRKQIQSQESKNIDQSNEENRSLSSSIPNLSHPKFQSQILSNTFLPLLLKTNLPPPLGAPSLGTGEKSNQPINGPGAFVQRGVPVVIEGMEMFVGELDQRTDTMSYNSSEGNGKEMKVRIGGISSGVGTGRNFGTVFELEYLPLKNLSNFSPFLPSLLYSLLPPTLLNPNLTNQQSRNPTSNANANQNANQNDPRNQNQSQNQTLEQPTPIILSSSVIQKETMAEALPSLFGKEKDAKSGKQKETQDYDEDQDQDQGWIGLEKGRRSCLLLLLMLKSEGILQ